MSEPAMAKMPLELTMDMIKAVKDHPHTSIENKEEWYTRLGWLICAYDILIDHQRNNLSVAHGKQGLSD